MATSLLPDLVYPSKPAKELIFDEINFKNSLALDYNDFDFGAPETHTQQGSTHNTKVIITAKSNSGFYGQRPVYYKRMNLADLLVAPTGLVLPATESTLHQLLPKINEVFGIGIRVEDVVDRALPVYGSLTGGIVPRILVEAVAGSILFIGSFNLALGPVEADLSNTLSIIRYYIHLTGYPMLDFAKALQAIDENGNADTSFNPFGNCTNITTLDITRLIIRHDQTINLNGLFRLTYTLGGVSFVIDCPNVVMSRTGAIIRHSSLNKFNANSVRYVSQPNIPFKYVIDQLNTDIPNRVVRYATNGILDTVWSCDLTYIPTTLSMGTDGLIYTASPVLDVVVGSTTVKQVRVDRMDQDGAIDSTFTPVIITAKGAEIPSTITEIFPIVNGGFWLLFLPLYGVGVNSPSSPIINGVAIVPNGVTEAYSWNPIHRFSQTGARVTAFRGLLKDNLDNSILVFPGSNMLSNNRVLFCTAERAGFLTHKDNPVTGYRHRQPIVFDDVANVRLITGPQYANQFRWVEAKNITVQPNGQFIVFGKVSLKLLSGGWGDTNWALGKYNADGSCIDIIFRKPLVDGANTITLRTVEMFVVPPPVVL